MIIAFTDGVDHGVLWGVGLVALLLVIIAVGLILEEHVDDGE